MATSDRAEGAPAMQGEVWDYVIVGSGFGGSIAAMRLAQKGFRVAVLEAGRRWRDQDFPDSNLDAKNYNWIPGLGQTGPLRITPLRHAIALGWSAVGGGSLLYGNTLFRPLDAFYKDPVAAKLGSRAEMDRYFDLATRMLGVTANPRMFQPDHWIREIAQEYRRGDTFVPSPVAINFSVQRGDPYFNGEGPDRAACTFCGACFIGCKQNAKNTLEKNYLYFAEKLGAVVYPETEVCDVVQLGGQPEDGYAIVTQPSTGVLNQWLGGTKTSVRTKNLVICAGVMGTLKLLLKLKRDRFPAISDHLGNHVMTNGEALAAVRVADKTVDLSKGIGASSSVFPDEHTQIQVDRMPSGSNSLAFLLTLMVDGGGRMPRFLRWLGAVIRHPLRFIRAHRPARWAEETMTLVAMQTLPSGMRVVLKGNSLGSRPGSGPLAPGYLPIVNDFARRLARRTQGEALSYLSEVWASIPVTAHILGGCRMGDAAHDSVLDMQNRVHGFPNIRVCDGSMITTNLGVNPSLTIAALTERAMGFVAPKAGALPRYFGFERAWPEARILFASDSNNDKED